MKKTIIDLFEDSVVKYGAKTFLLEKKHRAFEPTTYAETKEQALEIGAGLAAAGIRPGDKVAILSEGYPLSPRTKRIHYLLIWHVECLVQTLYS